MGYLRLLLVLYISGCLLWSLMLIYYLNKALTLNKQPAWMKTILSNGAAGEMVLFGSVIISPIFLLFSVYYIINKTLTRKKQ
jgi:uncharacterized membrane protein YdjX (TVP38/TMEM64 family)